eukprot:TRINITY_DN3001_c0_g1_i2.p1 TRINITY_DN3001_c0_g1~~TRINITY_DN3001_c0_g1_i2.p1  ORF type:complete len:174 (-),score=35.09 TRINITY_DN3001_c0_g1_i2:25-546(-)
MMNVSKALGIPMMITEYAKKNFGPTANEFAEDMHEGIQILQKDKFSVLMENHIKEAVEKINPKQVIAYGLEGHVCVQQSVLDLLDQGYEVHVLTDGTSSRTKLDRATALHRMAKAGAHLTTAEACMFDYVPDASSPEFKEMLAPIKKRKVFPEKFGHLFQLKQLLELSEYKSL